MARAHDTRTTGSTGGIGTGWRLFQVLALSSALGWLASYVLFVDPFQWVGPLLASGELPAYGDVIFDVSPIVSVIVVLLAISPGSLRFMQGSDRTAYLVRALVFAVPFLWMINVFMGSPMVNNLITQPLAASRMVPLFAGTFLHVVFQHWFQAIAAIAFALVPEQFATLTESPTSAGVQCAVVQCE